MRYFLTLAYNGTPFHGWQRQPNASSVQQCLEEALSTLLRQPITIVGAGRTDTGVHAKQVMAHFEAQLTDEVAQNLVYLLNRYLGEDIVIYRMEKVIPTAHARFDAMTRTYEYHLGFQKNPFKQQQQYSFHQEVSIERMNAAAKLLFDYNDFEAFAKTHSDVKTFLCDITHAHWESTPDGAIFTITANRFLRNMVRAIVGTLLEVGTGKIEVETLHEIIQSKNRGKAGYSVPAAGLYLTKITYPKNIFL